MVLGDFRRSFINLYSSVVDEDRLFIELMHAPDHSPSTTIICISASLNLKEEGDIHREDRGGMMMGVYIGGRGG